MAGGAGGGIIELVGTSIDIEGEILAEGNQF